MARGLLHDFRQVPLPLLRRGLHGVQLLFPAYASGGRNGLGPLPVCQSKQTNTQTNTPTNQPINKSTNQLINQSTNRSTKKAPNHGTHQKEPNRTQHSEKACGWRMQGGIRQIGAQGSGQCMSLPYGCGSNTMVPFWGRCRGTGSAEKDQIMGTTTRSSRFES